MQTIKQAGSTWTYWYLNNFADFVVEFSDSSRSTFTDSSVLADVRVRQAKAVRQSESNFLGCFWYVTPHTSRPFEFNFYLLNPATPPMCNFCAHRPIVLNLAVGTVSIFYNWGNVSM